MENSDGHSKHLNKVTFGGLLVALGIVFGDIGTSPLYTFAAIVGEREITETLALGALSAVFWTLTLQTTIKYILIVLSADNNGEGGVFSLYALIYEKAGKWILYPTIVRRLVYSRRSISRRRLSGFFVGVEVCGFTRRDFRPCRLLFLFCCCIFAATIRHANYREFFVP